MDEIVFFPDSGGPFLMWFGVVAIVLFGGLTAAYFFRAETIDWKAPLGLAVPLLLGGVLVWMAVGDARAVAFDPNGVVVRYVWPRPDRAIPVGGTSKHETVHEAAARINERVGRR